MNAKELLNRLGVVLSVSTQLSSSDTCALQFDDLDVHFEIAADRLYVLTELAVVEKMEEIAVRLLKANFLGNETGGATLALDDESHCVTLHTAFDDGISYECFEKRLALFVRAARYWRVWLSTPTDLTKGSQELDTEHELVGLMNWI